jgi:hypothetical protein
MQETCPRHSQLVRAFRPQPPILNNQPILPSAENPRRELDLRIPRWSE